MRLTTYTKNYRAVFGVLAVLWIAGCATGPMRSDDTVTLADAFDNIVVGQTDAATVLEYLPADGTLHSTASVSSFEDTGFGEVLGIVLFDATESMASDTVLFEHHSSQPVPLARTESLDLTVTMTVPEAVLGGSYENETRQYIAIVDYAQSLVIRAGGPFIEDRRTESLIGLSRTMLATAVRQGRQQPRNAGKMRDTEGFRFDHPTLGHCDLWLRQLDETIYRVMIHSGGLTDPLVDW